MKSEEMAGQGKGRLDVQTALQAKRAGPDLEAGPETSAERSEGTMEACRGETPQRLDAQRATRSRMNLCFRRKK